MSANDPKRTLPFGDATGTWAAIIVVDAGLPIRLLHGGIVMAVIRKQVAAAGTILADSCDPPAVGESSAARVMPGRRW
jgi:hypothetical protein